MNRAVELALRGDASAIQFFTSAGITFTYVEKKWDCLRMLQQPAILSGMIATAWICSSIDMDTMTALPIFLNAELNLTKAHVDRFATSYADALIVSTLCFATGIFVVVLSTLAHLPCLRRLPTVVARDAEHMRAPKHILVATVYGPIALAC